jgi:hypothetical protein
VHRVRGEVVKLVSQTNWTLGYQRNEGGLTGAEEEGGALARLSSGKGKRGGRSWCEENSSSGGPFYRRSGRGGGGEVASTGEACRGDDDGAQWWRRDGSGQTVVTGCLGAEARHQFGWWRVMTRGCGGAVAGGDRVDSRSRARERELTSGACSLERGRTRGGKGGRG